MFYRITHSASRWTVALDMTGYPLKKSGLPYLKDIEKVYTETYGLYLKAKIEKIERV